MQVVEPTDLVTTAHELLVHRLGLVSSRSGAPPAIDRASSPGIVRLHRTHAASGGVALGLAAILCHGLAIERHEL